MQCITQCPNIAELLQEAPLRMMYHNYKRYHRKFYTLRNDCLFSMRVYIGPTSIMYVGIEPSSIYGFQ